MTGYQSLTALLGAAALLLCALPANPAEPPAANAVASCHTLRTEGANIEQVCITQADFYADVCRAIDAYATRYQLPPAYFARVIWQESRFDPNAQSHAGAEGIAQFIPSTARLRGLEDAFDPSEALARSAEYLRALELRFGNLGLAAAAYNGGENRMQRYVDNGGGGLPYETRDYVRIVTGREVDDWLAPEGDAPDYGLSESLDFQAACVDMAKGRDVPSLEPPLARTRPWGVLLAQDFVKSVAVRRFERVQKQYAKVIGGEELMLARGRNPNFGPRLRYFAMIGRDSKAEAEALCRDLRQAGGSCLVRRN